MRFRHYVAVSGVFLSLCLSWDAYSGNVKVPQYLVDKNGISDPETGEPIPQEIQTVQHLPSDPQVLVFSLVGTTNLTKLKVFDLDFAKYIKKFLESSEGSYRLVFGQAKPAETLESSESGESGNGISSIRSLGIMDNSGKSIDFLRPFFLPKLQKRFKQVLQSLYQGNIPDNLNDLDQMIVKTEKWETGSLIFVYQGSLYLFYRAEFHGTEDFLSLWGSSSMAVVPGDPVFRQRIIKESTLGALKEVRKELSEKYALERQQQATERHQAVVNAVENCNSLSTTATPSASTWREYVSSYLPVLNWFGAEETHGQATREVEQDMRDERKNLDHDDLRYLAL